MNNENKQENMENENHLDKEVISRIRNFKKEIRVPRYGFESAMALIERKEEKKVPVKSPFMIPTFIKITVPALALILIVGFPTKKTIEGPAIEELAMNNFQTEIVSDDFIKTEEMATSIAQESTPEQGITLMKSADVSSETTAPDFGQIISQEFSTYQNTDDSKFASYDEKEVTNFVNYYEENF